MRPQIIRGSVFQGQTAVIRAEVVDAQHLPINRDLVEHIRITLYRKGGEPDTPIQEWSPSYFDAIFDVPQTHVNDPGWTYRDRGYNFCWEVPGNYLVQVGTYQLEALIFLRDERHAYVKADITVEPVYSNV